MRIKMINKNKNKPLWLDLELREDIDDYITLIFALDNNLNIQEISIHNPSINELNLLKETLKEYKKNVPIIVSGDITEYSEDKDIHQSLLKKAIPSDNKFYCSLKDYLDFKDINDRVFFCGGSLFTLSKFLEHYNESTFEAYIQGGFAGKDVVGEENTLKKFKKRDKVPTWNLNLDLESTDKVLKSDNVNIHFISKNVCHASFVGIDDLNQQNSKFNQTLKDYFGDTNRKKCMHDLLAFMTIFNDDVVKFKNVDLHRTNEERVKWHSVINENSSKEISVSFDYQLFLNFIDSHKPELKTNKKLKR